MLNILHRRAGVWDEDLVERAFAMRAQVMFSQMGWRFPGQNPVRDEDAFDTEDTLHFISADDDGTVTAYGRLNPTMGPHMFSEHFSEYCHFSGVVRDPRVFEHTRYLVDQSKHDRKVWRRHRGAVEIGIAALCAAANIDAINWLSSLEAYTHVASVNPSTRPLGLPVPHAKDDRDYVAAISDSVPAAVPFMLHHYQFTAEETAGVHAEVARVKDSVASLIKRYERPVVAA